MAGAEAYTPWNAPPGYYPWDDADECEPEPEIEDDGICMNGNACQHPFCPEHN